MFGGWFKKKGTHKEQIKSLLADYSWHPFMELNKICYRYGARLYDLRREGIDHEIKSVGKIKFYRLVK